MAGPITAVISAWVYTMTDRPCRHFIKKRLILSDLLNQLLLLKRKKRSFCLEEDQFAPTRSLALHPFFVHVVVC